MKEIVDVLLCGANGKMGRVIESCIAAKNDMRVIAGIDLNTNQYAGFPIFESFSSLESNGIKADVIIDFTHPSLLPKLVEYALEHKTPVVLASTGYSLEQIEQIKKIALEIAVFFTFNMSLGVNLLIDLARRAAAVLGSQFDVEIIERHHNQKLDAPSGTAIMLANAINETMDNKYQYEYDRHSKRQKRPQNEIGIHSVRGGTIVGDHEVLFAGRDETVTLRHTATSKEVFAVGAVNAAAFLHDKPPGLYDMGNLLNEQQE